MSLRDTFRNLYAEATARERDGQPGQAYRRLQKGASVTVRVADKKRQVILSRRGAPVGEVEILTFRRHGDIPEHAARQDYQGAQGWHYVALTWEAPATLWEMPQVELPPSL